MYKRYVDDTSIVCYDNSNFSCILQKFNNSHPLIKFTMELENDLKIPFLDVELTLRDDGTLRRCIHRKRMWNDGQLTHFYGSIPLSRKRALVSALTHCIRKICSSDCLKERELLFVKNILAQNCYLTRFVEKDMKPKPKREECDSAPKKTLYMNLNFMGGSAVDILKRRISCCLKWTSPEAKVMFSSHPILLNNAEDKLSHMISPVCMYQFTCSYGAKYIGRCMRVLSKRVTEHYPA
uniref:Helix-turn-helix domain-containing protein n=1 Tax=Trichobilharzia regenti TaxID=157069 RepID=A0AA85IX24_TRIRE|nr:unnamed protein product [Trichobilharzia regenti]